MNLKPISLIKYGIELNEEGNPFARDILNRLAEK